MSPRSQWHSGCNQSGAGGSQRVHGNRCGTCAARRGARGDLSAGTGMSTKLLVIVPLLQASAVLLLLTMMTTLRIARMKLAERIEQQQEYGFGLVRDWLAGKIPDEVAVAGLDTCIEDALAQVARRTSRECKRVDWEAAVGLLRRTTWFERMKKNARSRLWWRRLDAARCLYELGRLSDADLAVRLIKDHNATVRIVAARIVRRVAAPELIRVVLEQALHSEPVLQSYLLGLLKPYGVELVGPLIDIVRSEESGEALESAIKFMAEIQDPEFAEPLLARAYDARPEIRAAVAAALGHFPGPRTASELVRLLSDEDWRVRAEAAGSLGSVVAVDATDLLRERLHDEEFPVRLRAAVSLCQLGSRGLQCLLDAIRSDRAEDAELARYVLRFQNRARIEKAREMLEA
ncbi:MAG: HEAT repeat domain-containing protein [Deltaproteobacteria bacterium]|nr:MAG: HEAT repeat domain-containing protein [Deltaproteobacteria bacterium]